MYIYIIIICTCIYIYIYIHIGNDMLGYTSLKHADSYCSEDVPT